MVDEERACWLEGNTGSCSEDLTCPDGRKVFSGSVYKLQDGIVVASAVKNDYTWHFEVASEIVLRPASYSLRLVCGFAE